MRYSHFAGNAEVLNQSVGPVCFAVCCAARPKITKRDCTRADRRPPSTAAPLVRACRYICASIYLQHFGGVETRRRDLDSTRVDNLPDDRSHSVLLFTGAALTSC